METLKKPDREPDHVTSYGSAYWWQEMVYLGATGHLAKMVFDGELGALFILYEDGSHGKVLATNISDVYRYWLYGAFEDAVLSAGEKRE